MAMSGIGGVGSYGYNSGYNSNLDYESWVNSSNTKADEMKDKLDSTSSVNSSSSTNSTSSSNKTTSSNKTVSSTSGYLRNYQLALTDLESAAAALQTSKEGNVFEKYEKALMAADKAAQGGNEEQIKEAQAAVEKAAGDIVSAVENFANQYNNTVSFLKNNTGAASSASRDLAAFQRGLTTDKALQTIGLSRDTYGNLQVDKKKLTKTIEEGYGLVKEVVGGQYGMAERVGTKATNVLDSPVDKIVGKEGTTGTEETTEKYSARKQKKNTSALDSASLPDSFSSFANFARGGAYNLTNYYAVGMLLNTIA